MKPEHSLENIITPSRLKMRGIISRRLNLSMIEQDGKKKAVSAKSREPIVAFSIADLRNFFFLTQLVSLKQQSSVFNVGKSYINRELKREDNEEISDVLGCQILAYLNRIYHFIPENLPEQVVLKMFEIRGSFRAGGKSLESLNETSKAMFSHIVQVGDIYQPLKIIQLREFWQISPFSLKELIEIYSYGEIPEDMAHTQNSSINQTVYDSNIDKEVHWEFDKTFRLWLSFGLYFGIIKKQDLIEAADKIKEKNYAEFEPLRDLFYC